MLLTGPGRIRNFAAMVAKKKSRTVADVAETNANDLGIAIDLLREVLQGADILTDRKWMREAKRLVGDE